MPRKVGCFLNIREIVSDIHNLVHVCRLKSFNFPLSCSWSVQSVLHDFSVDMKFLLLRIEAQNSQRALLSSLGVFVNEEARSLLLAYLLCRIFQGLARGFSTLTDTHRLFWWMVVRRDCWDSSVIAWPSGGVATCTHPLLCSVLTLSTVKCSVCVSASRGGGGGTLVRLPLHSHAPQTNWASWVSVWVSASWVKWGICVSQPGIRSHWLDSTKASFQSWMFLVMQWSVKIATLLNSSDWSWVRSSINSFTPPLWRSCCWLLSHCSTQMESANIHFVLSWRVARELKLGHELISKHFTSNDTSPSSAVLSWHIPKHILNSWSRFPMSKQRHQVFVMLRLVWYT